MIRFLWNLFLIFTGLVELLIFPPLILINVILYFMLKPKPVPPQPQNITVVVKDGKD